MLTEKLTLKDPTHLKRGGKNNNKNNGERSLKKC